MTTKLIDPETRWTSALDSNAKVLSIPGAPRTPSEVWFEHAQLAYRTRGTVEHAPTTPIDTWIKTPAAEAAPRGASAIYQDVKGVLTIAVVDASAQLHSVIVGRTQDTLTFQAEWQLKVGGGGPKPTPGIPSNVPLATLLGL
jgi:hypothetical protein